VIPGAGREIDDCDFIQYRAGIKYFFRRTLRKLKKRYTKSSVAGCRRRPDGWLSFDPVAVKDARSMALTKQHRFKQHRFNLPDQT
jgi:hypothetical protein